MDFSSPTKSQSSDSDVSGPVTRSTAMFKGRDTYQKLSPHPDGSPSTKDIKASSRSPDPKRKNRLYPNVDDSDDEIRDDEHSQSRDKTLSPDKRKDDRGKTPHPTQLPKDPAEGKSTNLNIIYCAVIAVIVAIAITLALSKMPKKPSPVKSTIDCSELLNLTEKYPNQDKKLFKAIKAGTEGIYKRHPQVPLVMTLYSTDDDAIKTILRDVIIIAKKCINKNRDPLLLTSSDFNVPKFINDKGRVITEYKSKLEDRTIMVINDADKISTKVVGVLHSFADTYNPLVSEMILYLTVKVPEKPEDMTNSYIFEYLKDQWKDLASHIRDPLITRFLDQTFYINAA